MSFSRIARSLLMLLSANAIGRVVSAITVLLIARVLGPAIFGVFAGSLALAQLFSALFSFGLDGWLMRSGGQKPEQVGEFASTALSIKIMLGLVWLAFFVPITSAVERETLPFSVVILAALCVWLDELNYLVRAGYKAELENQMNVWLILIDSGVFLIWAVVCMKYATVTPQLFLAGRLFSSLVSFVIGCLTFFRKYRFSWKPARISGVLKQAVPFALSIGLASVYGKADVAIVTHALGGAYTGIYSSAVSLLSALFLIPASVYGVLLPIFSRLYHQEPRSVLRWVWVSVAGNTLLGLALSLVVFLSAQPLSMGILGEAYVDVGPVLRVLSWVLLLRCINYGLGAVIVAVGKQSQRLVAQFVSALFNIGVDLILISRANLSLIAVVYVLTELVLAIGYVCIVFRWKWDFKSHKKPALDGLS